MLKDLSKIAEEKNQKRSVQALSDLETLTRKGTLAGFAIVTWDMDGRMGTVCRAYEGVVGRTMVPMLTHDALLKHIAIAMTVEELEDENRIPR